jgi:hypothetical protein
MDKSLGNTTEAFVWGGLVRHASRKLFGVGACVVLGLVGGCSGSEFDLAPASGIVTIDGVPFTAGKVMFAPIAQGEERRAGRPALGRLQADGSFKLSTYEDGDGAVVGEHWATIIRLDDEAAAPAAASVPAFSRLLIPTKQTVVAGEDNRFEIKLTRDEVLKLGEKGG